MSVFILLFAVISLLAGYIFYGKFVSKKLGIDPDRKTPAHTMYDGIDYCPAKMPVLFGHHFASIAGAAPIVGVIVASAFGWLPVLLWLVIGGIFIGGAHDLSALIASVRHRGRSIGEVIGINVGYLGKQLFLIFLWFTLVLVIAVFIVVVGQTFVDEPSAGTSSALFIGLAVVFGLTVYKWKAPLLLASIVGVAILFVCVSLGWYFPLKMNIAGWNISLMVYIFLASVLPVWFLLQPRDYLNSFLLYALIICAFVGIFVAHPAVNLPAFTGFINPELGSLFPILFVTVACGAISGFHSVVASGTTSKQLNTEADARAIGYGAMIVETLVAVIALITAVMLKDSDYSKMLMAAGPVAVFAGGVGKVMSSLGFAEARSVTFAALAVSAFVLTSLDTATRLARYAFQEFFAPRQGQASSILNRNRFIATAVTVAASGALAWSGKWQAIWPIFGAANQLLAALTLLAVTVWLMKGGIKAKFTAIPMVIMFAITLSALAVLIWQNYSKGNYGLMSLGIILLGVSLVLVVEAVRVVRKK